MIVLEGMHPHHYLMGNGLCNTAFHKEGNCKISGPFIKEGLDRHKTYLSGANPSSDDR